MQPEWKIGPEQHCLWLAIHSRWTHTDRSGYLFWNTSAEMVEKKHKRCWKKAQDCPVNNSGCGGSVVIGVGLLGQIGLSTFAATSLCLATSARSLIEASPLISLPFIP